MFVIVKWKRFRVLTIMGIILTLLIGCSFPYPNLKIREIEFWTIQLQPQFTNYFNQLITDFEADNPGLSVRWVDSPWSEMESNIESAILNNVHRSSVELAPTTFLCRTKLNLFMSAFIPVKFPLL